MDARGRITLAAAALALAVGTAGPAFGGPDPTTGARGADQGATVLVTPTSAVAESAGASGDGFDWADAGIGALIALAGAGFGGFTVRLVAPRAEERPLASS